MFAAILGTHPELSRAELERVFGTCTVHSAGVALFDGELWPHLGGTSKIGQVMTTLDTVDIDEIFEYLSGGLANDFAFPSHKFSIGISIYGRRTPDTRSRVLQLKKLLRTSEYKPRLVIGKGQALSSAQVIHNRLTDPDNHEVIVSISDTTTVIARSVWVQDIERYTLRDMGRPNRDMETGMLPPKLAQIMINLAGGQHVYDPFCGTGVVLQEALLMGKLASGSDLSPRLVESTKENLDWLMSELDTPPASTVFISDARSTTVPEGVDAIVTEGYLGPLQHGDASRQQLEELAKDSDQLMRATLGNLAQQLDTGTTLCLALPAWNHRDGTIRPALAASGSKGVDSLSELGYNRLRLKGIPEHGLLYRREGQHVGRQLILLEKQ